MSTKPCYYISGTSTVISAALESLTCDIIATVTRVWLRTAEAGMPS
jgi:hypothetical protein